MRPTLAVLPLSPERAWATYLSWSGRVAGRAARLMVRATSGLQELDPHERLDLAPVDQRGPVRHDLLHGRTPARKAGHAGWPGEHERRDLPGEPLDRRPLPRPHAHPELDLGQVGGGRPAQSTVGGIGAHVLGEDLVEAQSEVGQALT